jgi:hypothetical protein
VLFSDVTSHMANLRERPTFTQALWEVRDRAQQLVEVTYVGTHERAPY